MELKVESLEQKVEELEREKEKEKKKVESLEAREELYRILLVSHCIPIVTDFTKDQITKVDIYNIELTLS